MSDRMSRVDEAMKREIMMILQEDINDPRVRHVTITSVEVTRDMTLAKVFYVVTDEETNKKDVAKGLHSAGGFVRAELSKRLSMKKMPRISFREDRTEERQKAIDSLFEKIEEELSGGREDRTEERNEDGQS